MRSSFDFVLGSGVRVCNGIWGSGKWRCCDCSSRLVCNGLENEP